MKLWSYCFQFQHFGLSGLNLIFIVKIELTNDKFLDFAKKSKLKHTVKIQILYAFKTK